jgi:hypothetical protein
MTARRHCEPKAKHAGRNSVSLFALLAMTTHDCNFDELSQRMQSF